MEHGFPLEQTQGARQMCHSLIFHLPQMYPMDGIAIGGGVSTPVLNLLRVLDSSFCPTVLTGCPKSLIRIYQQVELPPMKLSVVLMRSNPRNAFVYAIEFLVKASRRLEQLADSCSLIHGHSGHPVYALMSLFAKVRLGLPVVHTLYCSPGEYLLGDNLSATLKRLDRIVVLSKRTERRFLQKGFSREQVRRIPPPILVELTGEGRDPNRAKENLGLEEKYPVVFFAGNNLNREKGVDIAVRAFVRIREPYPDGHLIVPLLRDSQNVRFREWLRELGLINHVTIVGGVPDLFGVMAAADVVLAPFRSTSTVAEYPVTILEAMAMGKTVVCASMESILEFVEEDVTGYLVSENSPEECADRVLEVLRHAQASKEVGIRAKEFVRKYFSPDLIAKEYTSLYKELYDSTAS